MKKEENSKGKAQRIGKVLNTKVKKMKLNMKGTRAQCENVKICQFIECYGTECVPFGCENLYTGLKT